MTKKQLLRADKNVLIISSIIIAGKILSLLGLLWVGANPVKIGVGIAVCVLSLFMDIFAYCKHRGRMRCGMIMIVALLLSSLAIIICTDSLVYHMVSVTVMIICMAYMYLRLSLACGLCVVIALIAKSIIMMERNIINLREFGTNLFIYFFVMISVTFITRLRTIFVKEDLETVTSNIQMKMDAIKKKAEMSDELLKAKVEAERANQAKTQFLARISHEIRTPINAILGMNEMVLTESKEESIREYASDIKESSNLLLHLINDILDTTKLEAGKMEVVEEKYFTGSMINDLYCMTNVRAREKGLELIFDIEPAIPAELYGDDKKIRQIILNLLTNAIKYTDEGSVLFKMTCRIENNKAIIRYLVKDTGIGIREEDIAKIFNVFQRFDLSRNESVEGTGLGMNIVKNLLQLLGSELHIESVYEEGSEFFFDLEQEIVDAKPLGDFRERIQATTENASLRMKYVAPDAKILVVDDNEINRKVARGLLKRTRVKVSEADCGQACIKMLEEEKFDLIFMDYMMPIMDGIDTLKIIRSRHLCDDVPVIMLTADAIVGAKAEFLKAGFNDYLTKPIVPEKLDKMVTEYLPKELIIEGEYEKEEVSEETKLPELDEFDFVYAMNILSDKDILMNTLQDVKKMLGTLPEKLNDLYCNIDDVEQLNLYKIEVHALKSSAATVGALLLSKLARLLEMASIEKDVERIRILHPILLEEMSKHRARLLDVFPETEEKMQIENAELVLGYFDMLEMALTNDDYATADFICGEIQKYGYQEDICKMVDELATMVENMDSDAAIELIHTIKEKW